MSDFDPLQQLTDNPFSDRALTELGNAVFGTPSGSSSYGYQGGSSFNVGGGSNQSTSVQNPDSVWSVQSPYLQNLYSQATAMLGGSQQNQQVSQGMVGQGFGALQSLMNPGANPMMEVYQQQLQQGLERNILPSIRRESAGYGQIGGTRQGVAEGMAVNEAQRLQQNFAGELYNQDRNRMLAAAEQVPGMAQANMGIPWYGLNQLAGILGNPTVLGGGGFTQSTGSNFTQGGSEYFGENASGKKGFLEDTFPDRLGGGGGGGGGPSQGGQFAPGDLTQYVNK